MSIGKSQQKAQKLEKKVNDLSKNLTKGYMGVSDEEGNIITPEQWIHSAVDYIYKIKVHAGVIDVISVKVCWEVNDDYSIFVTLGQSNYVRGFTSDGSETMSTFEDNLGIFNYFQDILEKELSYNP